jgi:hypothetical protein
LYGCSNTTNLISNGKSEYKIFVSDKAIAPEKYAAEELQTYLYQISGCKMEITHRIENEAKLIYIGFHEAPQSLTANLNPSDFGNEEYIIRSDGKSLLIAGGETRGALYGVIGYLSDYLGCRWYTSTVRKVPSDPTISLSKIEDRQKPAFEYREVYWREAYDTAWEVHNRQDPSGLHIPDSMGGTYITYPFVHTFYALVPPEKYFAAHPEYFSEINGKRVGKDGQLCLTNPDVVKVAIATVFDWIKTHPKANVFSIDQNDGEGYCECKYCKALDEKEGSHSGTLINFVNQIADTIAKAYPKIKLQTLAYAYTVVPPKHIRPADNVMIRLCHYNDCAAHPIEGCVVNKPYLDQMNQWEHIAKKITIWEYYTDFQHYFLPFPNFESFSHDIKFYADRKVKGIFAEGTSGAGGEFAQLKSWVIAQLMWNPNQDARHLINEYVDNVYGESAEYIASYIQLLHDQLGKDAHLDIWAEPYEVNYLNQTTIRKADSLFALAKGAAAQDTALSARVEFAYLPILYTKLYYFSQGGTAYITREEMPAALSRFNNILERNHITSIAEDSKTYGNLEKFLERIQLAATSEFYTDWSVIGPFDYKEQQGLSKVYPPEKEFDSAKVYTGINGQKISWQKYNDNTTGYIDFNKIFSPSENVVAYARKIITLPKTQTMKFGVGNNDGIRIWINGKLVFNQATAVKGPNQHTFTAQLNKGQNIVLIKVNQLKHGWGFYFTHLAL